MAEALARSTRPSPKGKSEARPKGRSVSKHSPWSGVSAYMDDIARRPLVTREEERELAVRACAGDTGAREALVEANLRWVVKIAKEFMGRGLPLEDLIAEGNEGLLHAIDRFDPSRGFRITTYSAAWIRQRIGRAIASKSKMVRIPQYIWEVVGKTHKLWADLGRMPTVGEVKEKHDKYDETTIKRAIDYMGASITSLDTMTPSGLPLRELVGDDHAENPVESAEQTERHTILRQAISELPDPLRETLRMRYGFSDLGPVEPMTLQEIAVIEGVTREAVRQRVTRAENILRNTIIKRA